MKHFKRANIYKAANVSYNPTTKEAYSYSWWAFVKLIKGKIVFNQYTYSNSTSKHQSKVRSLLRDLNIKIDREVQVKDGLQHITTLKELNLKEKETQEHLAKKEAARVARRKEKAREYRLKKKQEKLLSQSQPLQLIQGGAA